MSAVKTLQRSERISNQHLWPECKCPIKDFDHLGSDVNMSVWISTHWVLSGHISGQDTSAVKTRDASAVKTHQRSRCVSGQAQSHIKARTTNTLYAWTEMFALRGWFMSKTGAVSGCLGSVDTFSGNASSRARFLIQPPLGMVYGYD